MNCIHTTKIPSFCFAILVTIPSYAPGLTPLISGVDRGSAPSSLNDHNKSGLTENVPIVADLNLRADAGRASHDDKGNKENSRTRHE